MKSLIQWEDLAELIDRRVRIWAYAWDERSREYKTQPTYYEGRISKGILRSKNTTTEYYYMNPSQQFKLYDGEWMPEVETYVTGITEENFPYRAVQVLE